MLGFSRASRLWRGLIFSTLALVIIYFLMTHYISKEAALPNAFQPHEDWQQWANSINRDVAAISMQAVPSRMVMESKCPACYGHEICKEIHRGDIEINIPDELVHSDMVSRKGVYFGKWGDKDIVVKTLDNRGTHNFKLFDSFICNNQSLPVGCNVSSAILNLNHVAVRDRLFLPENLQSA